MRGMGNTEFSEGMGNTEFTGIMLRHCKQTSNNFMIHNTLSTSMWVLAKVFHMRQNLQGTNCCITNKQQKIQVLLSFVSPMLSPTYKASLQKCYDKIHSVSSLFFYLSLLMGYN